MEIDIHEILEYFASTDFTYVGTFFEHQTQNEPPKTIIRRTNPFCGGIILPIKGSAKLLLNGAVYHVKPGTIVHAGPDMHIELEPDALPFSMAVLHYKICCPSVQTPALFNRHYYFLVSESTKLLDFCQRIYQNQTVPGAAAKFKSKCMFMEFLNELFELAENSLSADKSQLAENIMEYMRQNYAKNISINQVALHFKMDRRNLAGLFKKHVGMTPSDYLIECRILKAKELLYACTCPIKQVAECVGYADSLFFSRTFKKRTGLSPSQYREAAQNT